MFAMPHCRPGIITLEQKKRSSVYAEITEDSEAAELNEALPIVKVGGGRNVRSRTIGDGDGVRHITTRRVDDS